MNAINFYRNSVCLALIAAALLLPARSFAQAITSTDLSSNYFRMGPGLSMGGAYRGIADSTHAVIYNPAGIAQERGAMHVAADYAYQGDISSHMFGAGIVDFQTSPQIAYGLSFHRFTPTIGGISANVNQGILAFGYSLGKIIQIGVSGKGYWVNIDSPIVQGPRGIDMDGGILVRPISLISFGLTGYNLIRGNQVEEFPLMLGMGAALHVGTHAKLSADSVRNFQTPSTSKTNYNLGADFLVAESLHLRGGFAFDRISHNNYYSVGTVFDGPSADLTFTFSQRLSPTTETYAVTFDFKL